MSIQVLRDTLAHAKENGISRNNTYPISVVELEAALAECDKLRSALRDFITEYRENEECDCDGCVLCYAQAALTTTPAPIAPTQEGESE